MNLCVCVRAHLSPCFLSSRDWLPFDQLWNLSGWCISWAGFEVLLDHHGRFSTWTFGCSRDWFLSIMDGPWNQQRIWGFDVANLRSKPSAAPRQHRWLPARALSSGRSCEVSGNTMDPPSIRRPSENPIETSWIILDHLKFAIVKYPPCIKVLTGWEDIRSHRGWPIGETTHQRRKWDLDSYWLRWFKKIKNNKHHRFTCQIFDSEKNTPRSSWVWKYSTIYK